MPLLPTGSLERAAVDRVIAKHAKQSADCYKRARSSARGVVVVRIEVDTRGHVRQARVSHQTLPLRVGQCLAKLIASWQFPPPRGGMVVLQQLFRF
jgi:TonB family protein